MTYTRQRRPPPPPAPGVPLAEKLPQGTGGKRPVDAATAEKWAGWAPLLGAECALVTGTDGEVREVGLLVDMPLDENGKQVRVHAVCWRNAGTLQDAGAMAFRILAPARAYFAKITGAR